MSRNGRFDRVELSLIVFFVAVLAYQVGAWRGAATGQAHSGAWRHPGDDALEQRLRERYGPRYHSAHLEEWIYGDFFNDMRGGVFADVGAWKWQDDNNTVALEQQLGWSGIAVDAVADYAEGWRAHRPRSQFIVAFVDAVDGQPRTIDIPAAAPRIASAHDNDDMHRTYAAYQGKVRKVHPVSTTLDTVLNRAGIARLDFLSLDIELQEPAALAGFSVNRFRPRLVCVEAHPPVRQQVIDFAQHGYVVVGRYLRLDQQCILHHSTLYRPTGRDEVRAPCPRQRGPAVYDGTDWCGRGEAVHEKATYSSKSLIGTNGACWRLLRPRKVREAMNISAWRSMRTSSADATAAHPGMAMPRTEPRPRRRARQLPAPPESTQIQPNVQTRRRRRRRWRSCHGPPGKRHSCASVRRAWPRERSALSRTADGSGTRPPNSGSRVPTQQRAHAASSRE